MRHRASPPPAALARWVAGRLQQRELEVPLRHQFEEALEGTPADAALSVASYCRLFARHGTYTARDWRTVGRLSAHAANSGLAERRQCQPISLRTLSEYARKYICVPYRTMVERLGWEWVLEAALRTGGYVPASVGPETARLARSVWRARPLLSR